MVSQQYFKIFTDCIFDFDSHFHVKLVTRTRFIQKIHFVFCSTFPDYSNEPEAKLCRRFTECSGNYCGKIICTHDMLIEVASVCDRLEIK